eukprot:TRINITY_DN7201_c0_g1_i1.p1 TRINITY_DN7201_c0_g1~~TRINITY_DN7201_c0_g1_i1.p1  ORF type:complete len:397 (-),score=137.50 TRINITY_DN7201_c0_g1_i1:3-1193(-)
MNNFGRPRKKSSEMVYIDPKTPETPKSSAFIKLRNDSPHPQSPKYIAHSLVRIVRANLNAKGVKRGARTEFLDLDRILTTEKRRYNPWIPFKSHYRAVFPRFVALWNEYSEAHDDEVRAEIFGSYFNYDELEPPAQPIPRHRGKENISPTSNENYLTDMKPPASRPTKKFTKKNLAKFSVGDTPLAVRFDLESPEKNEETYAEDNSTQSQHSIQENVIDPPIPHQHEESRTRSGLITSNELLVRFSPRILLRKDSHEFDQREIPIEQKSCHMDSKGFVYSPEEMETQFSRFHISENRSKGTPNQNPLAPPELPITPKKRKTDEIPVVEQVPQIPFPSFEPVMNPIIFDPNSQSNKEQLARRCSEAWKIYWCSYFAEKIARLHGYQSTFDGERWNFN